MRIENLDAYPANTEFETDVVIIGGGPAGLAIAREFIGHDASVLVLESGLEVEEKAHMDLNRLSSDGEPSSAAAIAFRKAYHGANCAAFDQEAQPYGIRMRTLGGSAGYWGGRSAVFDKTDFSRRDWMPFSGWPISRESLEGYFERGAQVLNLGPNIYDEKLWRLIDPDGRIKRPRVDPTKLSSHFWQFARSRLKPSEMTNFKNDYKVLESDNVRTLINATVTHINTDEAGTSFESLEISTIAGVRSKVKAKRCVMACGCIENARLLLVSNRKHPKGLGNQHDVVGRYLMDHPGTRIGCFRGADAKAASYMGFFSVRNQDRLIMYTHGFTPSPELQASEKLHNAGIYTLPEIAHDDPIAAVRRLVHMRSKNIAADLWATVRSCGLLATSVGVRIFQSKLTPEFVQNFVINLVMRMNPDFVVRVFQAKGVPHKLDAIGLHIMLEQKADPESRVVLTDERDSLGLPRVHVHWKISDMDRHTAVRVSQVLKQEVMRAGMPEPVMEDWVEQNRPQDAPLVDMAHSIGATRMSDDPRTGVVDQRCEVHGVKGLYIAGASVFPTSGQCNPTLMIVSLAIRVADFIKADLRREVADGQ